MIWVQRAKQGIKKHFMWNDRLPVCENMGRLCPWLISLSASLVHQSVSWQHSLVPYCAQGTAVGDQKAGNMQKSTGLEPRGSELGTPKVAITCPLYVKGQLQGGPKGGDRRIRVS